MASRVFLFAIAVIAWLAVALQIFLTTEAVMRDGFSALYGIVKALSYFTILTNLLVAVVATSALTARAAENFFTRPSTMSATAVYIAVVGIIYSLLLRALWEPSGLQLAVDVALHDAVPVLYVAYWVLYVPKGSLRWFDALRWLLYPLAYVLYTVVRGELTGDYPYPFANVAQLGYATVLANTALLLVVFFVLGLICVAAGRALVQPMRMR
jgi:hypothetical protein